MVLADPDSPFRFGRSGDQLMADVVVGAGIFGGRRRSDIRGGGGSEPRLWWISAHFSPFDPHLGTFDRHLRLELDSARRRPTFDRSAQTQPDFFSSAQLGTQTSRNFPSAQPAKHHTQIELKKYPRVPSAEPFLRLFSVTALLYTVS